VVGHGAAEPEQGFFGLLSGGGDSDPERLVDAAAEALLLGIGDPMTFLALGGDDWTIAAAVISRARRLHNERRTEELNQLAKAIGSHVGDAIAKLFS